MVLDKIDYSDYITLMYDQFVQGGCGEYAMAAVFNILREMECKYTPDVSGRFIGYGLESSNQTHKDRRVKSGLDQSGIMVFHGCCSETTWPDNFRETWGNPDRHPPPDKAFSEATNYRIKLLNPFNLAGVEKKKNPSIEQIKEWLSSGPIVGASDSHVFAIVGYDDYSNELTIQNSQGDDWGPDRNGMYRMPYSDIRNLPADYIHLEIKEIWRFEILPCTSYPRFTGRIRISHTKGRRFLVVKIWAEGQVPQIVWADRESDKCYNLNLDFPLPYYAAAFWPPSEEHIWHLSVTDLTPDKEAGPGIAAFIKEVTLAEKKPTARFRWTPTAYQVPLHEPIRVPYRRVMYIDIAGQTHPG
jgi:hypothetical protein